MSSRPLLQLLDWYLAMGADEAIGELPVDRLEARSAPARAAAELAPPTPRPSVAPSPAPPLADPSAAAASARELAFAARTLAELEAAVRGFEGCALKRTATNTVFADGNP